MKKSFYFSHDYNARNDIKIQEMFIEHGVSGYGIYWCIVEQLYENEGVLPLRSIKVIAHNLRVECEQVESIIKNYDLFEFDEEYFWSISVNNRRKQVESISQKRRDAVNTRWDKSKVSDNEGVKDLEDTNLYKSNTNVIQNDTNVLQTDTNKNKIKENKINNNILYNNNAREEKNLEEKVETDKPLYAEDENPNPQTYFDEAKKSPIWQEWVAMRYEITKNEVQEYLDKFKQECLCKETTHLSMNDFKSHFCNWLRIQVKELKKEKSKNNPNQGMPIGMRGQVKGKDFTEDWSQAEQASKKIYTEDWNI